VSRVVRLAPLVVVGAILLAVWLQMEAGPSNLAQPTVPAQELEAARDGPAQFKDIDQASAGVIDGGASSQPMAIQVAPTHGNRWVSGRLDGRVVDASGHPVADARVTLLPIQAHEQAGVRMPGASTESPRRAKATAECGEDGRFELLFDHPFVSEMDASARHGSWERYDPSLRVEAPGHATRFDRVDDWAGGVREMGDLHLVPGVCVTGIVVEADGRPVPEARVSVAVPHAACPNPSGADPTLDRAAHFAVTAGADGRFELCGAWPGTRRIDFRAPNDDQGTLDVAVDSEARALDVGEIVVGPITPVPDFVKAVMEQRSSGGPVADTRSTDGAGVDGRVLDADGQPLGFVWLEVLLPDGPSGPRRRHVRTENDGTFALRDGPAGRWRFESGQTLEGEVDVAAGEVGTIELQARRLSVLRGTVTAFGEPVEGAEVYPFFGGGGKWMWMLTGPDGRYELTCDYGPGLYEVCVVTPHGRRTDFEEFTREVGLAEAVEFDIDLGGTGVSGTVVSATDGLPIAGVRVTLAGGFGQGGFTTGADGRFLVGPVKPDTYGLVATSPHGRVERGLDLTSGGMCADQQLEFAEELGSLRVEIAGRHSAFRRPVLLLEGADGTKLRHQVWGRSATFEALSPGEWTLLLERKETGKDLRQSTLASTPLGRVLVRAREEATLFIEAALLSAR
jgi:Carboxypeptidase regulatory-like domain